MNEILTYEFVVTVGPNNSCKVETNGNITFHKSDDWDTYRSALFETIRDLNIITNDEINKIKSITELFDTLKNKNYNMTCENISKDSLDVCKFKVTKFSNSQ